MQCDADFEAEGQMTFLRCSGVTHENYSPRQINSGVKLAYTDSPPPLRQIPLPSPLTREIYYHATLTPGTVCRLIQHGI